MTDTHGKNRAMDPREKICWIDVIPPEKAAGRLADIYGDVISPEGNVDHVYQAQSLMPETIAAHDVLYKSVLHGGSNVLPGWFCETVGVYTSMLNGCEYAVVHHTANLKHLVNDPQRSSAIIDSLEKDTPESAFEGNCLKLLRYARRLVKSPGSITLDHLDTMRHAGISDREILEVNQVVAMFCYSVRVICGLGVSLGNEKIGLY